ncbi:hypothetical protein [Halorhabdus sp. SVX81]|uniref:COG1361 S-layer family protein n=1 Tax=Halorhabdus sp. SVX81 TaxID=2978283 RepID=UPI0023DA0324|nr:hypothetical protein [Halorhabdus sp. SVX81]
MGHSGSVAPRRKVTAIVLTTMIVGSTVAGVVSFGVGVARAANVTTVEGTPDLSASAPDARLDPGESGSISIYLENDATFGSNGTYTEEMRDRVTEARSISVNVTDTRGAPLTVETDAQPAGTLQDGNASDPQVFSVVVDEDAAAGTYELEVTSVYRHTSRATYEKGETGEYRLRDETTAERSDTDTITVEIQPQPRFEVEAVSHDVPLGGEGTVAVEMSNAGDEDVTEATVSLSSGDSNLYFGSGTATAEANVGSWGADESKTLRFRAGTADSAVAREYPVDVTVEYVDSDDAQQTASESIGITPRNRTRFDVVNVTHDVPRNGEGTLTVSLQQMARKTIEDVTVTASTTATDVYLGGESSRSSTTAIGTWHENETRNVTVRVGTTDDALARPYPIDLEFEYTDAADNDNTRTEFLQFVPGEHDDFSLVSRTHDVPTNGVGTLTVVVDNVAETNFSDVSVTASTPDSEIYVGSESSRSGTATVSEWGVNDTRRLTFRVGATANAVNRSYPLNVDFEYTDADDNDNQWTTEVAFRPSGEPQFVVESIDHDVPVGSSGRVTLTLRNDGPVNATQSVVTASSDADAMFFGTGGAEPIEAQGVTVEPPQTGTPTAQSYVGEWAVGETRTVSFRAGFDDDAIVREYVANLAVAYENEAGDDMPEQTRAVGITPLPEQRFSFDRLRSDLFVGEEGNLHVSVTNTGNRSVEGLVVTASTQDRNVNFYNSRYAVGSLSPNESATVRYRVGVTEEAEHGPRIFELSARYRDPQMDVRQTDTRDVTVTIGASRDAFALERTTGTLAPGESGPLTLTVTNRRNETLSNIQASLFTDDPLDSGDDSAFISALDPGESTTITLDITADGSASEKTYSASMEFRFDDERGESALSDTYRIPVVIERTESSLGVPVVLGGVGALVAIIALGWYVGAASRLRAIGSRLRQRVTSGNGSSDRLDVDESE